jgi:hypothetical protein
MYLRPQQLRVRIRILEGASDGINGAIGPRVDCGELQLIKQKVVDST